MFAKWSLSLKFSDQNFVCIVTFSHILLAAGTGNRCFSVQVSKGKLSDKKEVTVCDCCEKMKVELHDVKLELSSFREIIRVL
jgi:hypothetical protein